MKKCEVLVDTVIACQKGSIVMVSDKTFNLARHKLKEVEEVKKAVKPSVEIQEIETREEKKIETAELPKAKKTKKK